MENTEQAGSGPKPCFYSLSGHVSHVWQAGHGPESLLNFVAACRGLPKLVQFFLKHSSRECYAHRGEGRFRLWESHKTLHGCHDAKGWVEALLQAEYKLGVSQAARNSLEECARRLQNFGVCGLA